MPTSRRRPSRTRSQELAVLAPWMQHMMRVDDAERQGDALAALDLMEQMPDGPDGKPFWRPWRVERLIQIVALGPDVPSWVYGRWLLEQTLQHYDERMMRIAERAWHAAMRVRGGRAEVERTYPVDPLVKVVDHDWVYRQCMLYDFGGLKTFLRTHASPALIRRAGRIHEWARTPLGGYRLVSREAALLRFDDLADGSSVDAPNIGSAALLRPGQHVIGRLVPTHAGGVFESVPLSVPGELARSIAEEPTTWLAQVGSARLRDPWSFHVHRFGFVNDLPAHLAAGAILDPDEATTDAALGAALLHTAERALAGTLDRHADDVDVWPCLAALVVSPLVLEAVTQTATAADADLFARLGLELAEPASRVCRDIAIELRSAA